MTNRIPSSFLTSALLASVVVAGCASVPPSIDTSAPVTFDGLSPVRNAAADEAWARVGLDLSGYTKIKLESMGIEYRPGGESSRMWAARRGSGPYEITEPARLRLESLLREVFLDELGKGERYTIVQESGPDVLVVRGGLLDVVSFVPPETVGRSDVYLRSVGEATLVVELRDSITNAILARSVDRRAAERPGQELQWSNPVNNAAEVRRLARRWAIRLRENLDAFLGPR